MAGGVVIRRGRKADSKGFLKLLVALAKYEKLDPPTPAAQKRILKDVFEKRRASLVMAIRGGVPIGYAFYFYTYSSFLAKPTLYLEDIFVLKEFRGFGVGKSLFVRCVKEASIQGCGRMEWSVLNWNSRAIRFYRRMGARRMGEWSVFRLDERALNALVG
ncbi:MAG: GNAT family N-acetyltransferase [Nitrososphaerota archaeon]|nr:GNAT family N-acetyltransferase [Nitrososphaerota archaeon]